jgi:hypothetical protein
MYAVYRLPCNPSPHIHATAGILAPLLPVIFFDPFTDAGVEVRSPSLLRLQPSALFIRRSDAAAWAGLGRHRAEENGQYHFMVDLIIGVRTVLSGHHVTAGIHRRLVWPGDSEVFGIRDVVEGTV